MDQHAIVSSIIDVERYPILQLADLNGRSFLDTIRKTMRQTGACDLPGFVRPDAVRLAVTAVLPDRAKAFRIDHLHDVEFTDVAPNERTHEDPLRQRVRTAKGGLAYDEIGPDSPVRQIYESDAVTAFIAAALEIRPLHRLDDPLGALNVMFYEPGDELGWHFDAAEFVVTIALQSCQSGGDFEYVPMLRTEHDRNDVGVRQLLSADRSAIRTIRPTPGTLSLFRGHWSPHRVTTITGTEPRITAVLSYSRLRSHTLTPAAQVRFYGRTAT